ncbi:hypothetical protein BY458DRAFT_161551 [Sporodiniella umbellata]|nr:hypothetical protein BY458DRAFT_161551 [Sporodiniella umbellata]
MAGSFSFVEKPRKKVSLEQSGHRCPKCKHDNTVRLMRSEKQWILFNKCINSTSRVRYECSRCRWKNGELPEDADCCLSVY